MIPNYILNDNSKILVLFDMDGVCAEFKTGEVDDILNHVPGVYIDKRPIKSIINTMDQLNELPNVKIGILSSCECEEQRQEKLSWLKKYVPYIEEKYIEILIWPNESYTKETRSYVKVKKFERFKGFDKIYLVEDTHSIIDASNEVIPNCAHHFTEFLD